MGNARSYDHVLSFALEHPWAVTPSMRTIIAGILAHRLAGLDADPAAIQAALVNRKNLPQPGGGAVAVIPIYGVIAPRMNLMSDMSGGTTFEALTAQLAEAVANKAVKTIVFDVDSPGGSVAGATEFAAAVREARTKKPIIAQAQYLMASAAYWPMANATQIVASPSANIGSVGVYGIHEDVTEAMAKLGVKQEVISAGKYKAEAAGIGPLTDQQRGHLQSLIDAAYDTFLGDISKGRGVAKDVVRSGYGEGRVLNAKDALAAGMIDGIATLSETLARALAAPPSTGASAHATVHQRARASLDASLDEATEPSYAVGDRVRALVDHMKGMAGRVGKVTEAHAGDPPYYAVLFDGDAATHKWLAENEVESEDAAAPTPKKKMTASALDTAQERASATAQDRAADVTWQNGIEAQLLELDL